MMRSRLLFASVGGIITTLPSDGWGIAPKLDAAELAASLSELAQVTKIEAESLFRLPSPSLRLGRRAQLAERIEPAFAAGMAAATLRCP